MSRMNCGRLPVRARRSSGRLQRAAESGHRGRPHHTRVLDAKIEAVIQAAIKDLYLTRERPRFSDLMKDIEARCHNEDIHAPDYRTVQRRVEDIDARTATAARRSNWVGKPTQPQNSGPSWKYSQPSGEKRRRSGRVLAPKAADFHALRSVKTLVVPLCRPGRFGRIVARPETTAMPRFLISQTSV
jgi:hypothetical protein